MDLRDALGVESLRPIRLGMSFPLIHLRQEESRQHYHDAWLLNEGVCVGLLG